MAKILLFDIETTPNLAYVWGKWEQDVIEYKKEWELLSFAYKWLDEKEVHCETRQNQKDDYKLCVKLHKILSEADVVVAHNGNAFDIKKSKARFLYHNLPPITPLVTVDTKLVAKSVFNFNSNSLNDIGKYLKVGQKQKHTGFELWLGCMSDDKDAWKLMIKYNKQDVVLLEKVYKAMKPWLARHPSVSALNNVKDGCPKCGSLDVVKKGVGAGFSNLRQKMNCKSCGGWYLVKYIGNKI